MTLLHVGRMHPEQRAAGRAFMEALINDLDANTAATMVQMHACAASGKPDAEVRALAGKVSMSIETKRAIEEVLNDRS